MRRKTPPSGEVGMQARAIVLDIEGTVAPIRFVHEVLFPHARQNLEAYLRRHWNEPAVADARQRLADEPGDEASFVFTEASLACLLRMAFALMDGDVKSTGLKQLQGLIWEEGYAAGAFTSPLFSDVLPALRRWTLAGKTISVYSSGSVAAQKVFFGHTCDGDVTPLLTAYFDTTTGPKKSPASYTTIAAALNLAPAELLFLSDSADEVRAATAAGLDALVVMREGNAPVAGDDLTMIESF